jgi:hypothetical protein
VRRRGVLVAGVVVVSWSLGAAPDAPAAPAAPRVLLTGDSMMENLGTPLAAGLRADGVRDVRVDPIAGSGLTIFDWVAQARRHMAVGDPPEVTVMLNGAGDTGPLPVGPRMMRCCGPAWRAEYARRARSMMRTYGRVYWLTLPMPRNRGHARVMAAVNRAVRDAAAAVGSSVTIVDLVPVLTPGRRFRRTLDGRVIRRADGIHLTRAGAGLAAARVRRAMRAELRG